MGNLAGGLLLLAAGVAHTGGSLEPLRTCNAQRDDAARLACFDREVAALLQPKPTAPEQPPAAAEPVVQPESQFGWSEAEAHRRANKEAAPAPARLGRLTVRVSKVQGLAFGRKRITLENGQVWTQVMSSEPIELQSGDRVTIRPGMLGSFLMVDPRGHSAKVHREQ
jgi:hypothetical protein